MDYIPQRGDLVWMTFDPQARHTEFAFRLPDAVMQEVLEKLGTLLVLIPK